MAKVKTINKAVLKTVRSEVEIAMEKIAKKHGLVFKSGNIGYTSEDFSFKNLNFAVANAEGKSKAAESKFSASSVFYGIAAEALGFSFKDGRKTMTITGWNSKASKNKILMSDEKGGKYHCPVDYVKNFLPKNLILS